MTTSTATKRARAVLFAVHLPAVSDQDHEASLAELSRLVETLGFEPVMTISQRRAKVTTGTIVGEGKLRELAAYTGGTGIAQSAVPVKRRKALESELDELDEPEVEPSLVMLPDGFELATKVVYDGELTPQQLRNLETATGAEVLDRTGVIVEIFHRHAKTREARLQVEIARLRYLAPRLRQSRVGADREGAGIGAKGVGETAHELDKRRIRDRISELTRELSEIQRSQDERRQRRVEQQKVALVGYTNAGKSSLMRALTGSEVLVQDKLFATLDTTIRALQPETQPRILISDTVGFIKKLPHDLVASFRSTLDEAAEASLKLFVVDASDPTFRSQLAVTQEVLHEIGADEGPSLLILNKSDRLSPEQGLALKIEFPKAVLMSSKAAPDVSALHAKLQTFFEKSMQDATLLIPYDRGEMIGEIHRTVRVLKEDHLDTGTEVHIRGPEEQVARLTKMLQAPKA